MSGKQPEDLAVSRASHPNGDHLHIGIAVMNLGVGGAQRAMTVLANALVKKGHHVDLLVGADRGGYKGDL